MLRRRSFTPKPKFEALKITLSRTHGTLGITLTVGTARVTAVAEGSTAAEAGLQVYDRIVAVNGNKLAGTLGDALAAQQV